MVAPTGTVVTFSRRMTSSSLSRGRRRPLQLLASSRHGASKGQLALGHGGSRQRLAAAEREVVRTGGKAVEVVRLRITAAGRRAIGGE
jgi:hypothetical protein